jgi:hypothetical protein
MPYIELSDEEMIHLAEKAEIFSFLDRREEDFYTAEDGEAL